MRKHQHINPFTDMDLFIQGLQREDVRYYKMTRNFQWLMWILVPLYTALFIFNPARGILLSERIGGVCYVIAFILFALIFRKFTKEFKNVDYGIPVVAMLKLAVKRYSLYQRKLLLIIPPVLIIDAGMVFLLTSRNTTMTDWEIIVESQLLIFSSLLVGGIIGYFIWRKRQKPLRDAALEMLREFDS